MNLDRPGLQFDGFAVPRQVIGALALDLDRGILRRDLLDQAGEARQQRADRVRGRAFGAGLGDAAFSVLRWLQTCWRSGSGAVASSSPSWCNAAAWALTAPRGCGVRLVDLTDLDLLGVQVVSQASAIAPVNSTPTRSTGPKPRSQPVSRR